MSYTHFLARQSGRTTRMLKQALDALVKDHAVYILSADETRAHHLKERFRQVCQQSNYLVASTPKFETLRSIGQENIDWVNTRIHRAHSNCRLFIDHHVYEHVFGHLINGYHAYDSQIVINPLSVYRSL